MTSLACFDHHSEELGGKTAVKPRGVVVVIQLFAAGEDHEVVVRRRTASRNQPNLGNVAECPAHRWISGGGCKFSHATMAAIAPRNKAASVGSRVSRSRVSPALPLCTTSDDSDPPQSISRSPSRPCPLARLLFASDETVVSAISSKSSASRKVFSKRVGVVGEAMIEARASTLPRHSISSSSSSSICVLLLVFQFLRFAWISLVLRATTGPLLGLSR